VLGGFLGVWCFLVAGSPDAEPLDIPYDVFWRFSPRVDMVKKPIAELWAVKKNDEKVKYVRQPVPPNKYEYRDTTLAKRPWSSTGVKAIEFTHDGQQYRFEPKEVEAGSYPMFVSPEGWRMKVYETGPDGIPDIFRTGRFIANLTLNLVHLVLWFACLWLLLRFQWSHALGLAFCLWLLVTIVILPLMLSYAAQVAQNRHRASASADPPASMQLVQRPARVARVNRMMAPAW